MNAVADEPDGATPLDPDELDGLRHRHVTTRAELNELEQANIEAGLLWLARQRKTEILEDSFLRELHRRLFGGVWTWAGGYRLREKNIGIDPLLIGVQVRQALRDAAYWADHDTFKPLEAAARFHHALVKIHPFPNGNGRHARISADVYLAECFRMPPINWSNNTDMTRNSIRRTAYIAALRAADNFDFAPLLSFVGLPPDPDACLEGAE